MESDINDGFAECIFCNFNVNLGSGTVIIMPDSLKKVKKTINGSYILSNGVIILVDEDVESFLEGTLIFYENVGTKI